MSLSIARWTPIRLAAVVLTIAAILIVPRLASSLGSGAAVPDQPLSLDDDAQGPVSGTSITDRTIATLQRRLRNRPRDFMSHIELANVYLQKVRETGDPSFYGKTEALLKEAARLDAQQPDLLATQGSLALARHDFRSALTLGQQAVARNPYAARYYGVVADAQIELGMYQEALASLQAMVDRRPDFGSYSRIAYARELHGDLDGAIEAMHAAIAAGGPVPENTAWAYVQLGNLWFNRGNLGQATQQYDLAQRTLPNFPAALAAQARVAAARANLKEAASLYQQAFARMPLAEYAIALGDVYMKLGDRQQAQQQYDLVRAIDTLFTANGVNTDLETALFFADHDIELPASLARARAAYAARPSIHASDVLAWTLYKTGNLVEAQHYAGQALKLGTRDALKRFHAGMIANALGQQERARSYLQEALSVNPHFSLLYAELAAATLRELGTGRPTTAERNK